MALKIFHTPKPNKFSIHARYHNPKTEKFKEHPALIKGSFTKHRNRYKMTKQNEQNYSEEWNRKILLVSIFIGLFSIVFFVKGSFMLGFSSIVLSLFGVLSFFKRSFN